MRNHLIWTCAAALTIGLIGGCTARSGGGNGGGEEKIALDKTPTAVQASVRRLAGANQVHTLTKEMEDGQTVYEAEWSVNGAEHSAVVNSNGDVLEEETEIRSSDLPPVVADAVKRKYPNGKLGEAGSLTQHGKPGYEVEVMTGGVKHELKLSANGDIMSDKTERGKGEGAEKD